MATCDHGTLTIEGRTHFKVPTSDFIISPLATDAHLIIASISPDDPEEREVGDIAADEYTKVTGAVPYIDFYIDTDETYCVKY